MKVKGAWEIAFVKFSGLFLKWKREELWEMDQKKWKLTTMGKALQSRDDSQEKKEVKGTPVLMSA